MDIYVNYLAVLVAAIANMVLGFLWYGKLFGKQWMALSGRTQQSIEQTKANSGGMWKPYTLAFIGSLVMAFVLRHSIVFAAYYMDMTGIQPGLTTGFWMWLGFIAPITLGTVLWDGKSWKLWFLTNGYYLLSLLIMGTILAAWA